MADVLRPLPAPVTPEARPYWDGAREGKLMIPKCQACGKAFLYPRVLCPFCASRDITWIQASGRGTLHSFEIAHQILNKAFKVERDECLILDDQDIGCDFSGQFPPGFLNKFTKGRRIHIENFCGVILG